jgi:hypothetical protein
MTDTELFELQYPGSVAELVLMTEILANRIATSITV